MPLNAINAFKCLNIRSQLISNLFSTCSYPKKLSRASFRSSDVREKLNLPEDDKQLPSLIIRCVNKFLASSDPGITLRHVPMKQRKADGEYEDIDSRRRKVVWESIKYIKLCFSYDVSAWSLLPVLSRATIAGSDVMSLRTSS